jgi:inner membrane protein
MDNVCHTLVGAALGEAGLKSRTRYGNATLMIAANLPDLDVLVFASATPSVEFRRGWTHGLVAELLLPVLLTAAVVLYDRLRRRPPAAAGPPLSVPWLLALSSTGVLSHVFLDYLNNYGVRLLAPLDWRWFYSDAVFIVDPWLWLSLGAGVWLARRRQTPVPARGALAFATCYVVIMLLSAQQAQRIVLSAWRTVRQSEPLAVMAGPLPVTPFTRTVVVDAGDHYETGTFSWWTAAVTFDREPVAKNAGTPEALAARADRTVRAYLGWSRFPFWTVTRAGTAARVSVGDMRFPGGPVRLAATTTVRER